MKYYWEEDNKIFNIDLNRIVTFSDFDDLYFDEEFRNLKWPEEPNPNLIKRNQLDNSYENYDY